MNDATPWDPFGRWWAEAEAAEPRVPDAAQVATVSAEGLPSIRTVLIKGWGPEGLVFFTNYRSRKGLEIAATGHVALLLHWKALERQVIVEGPAERTAAATSEAYWRRRPRESQIGAWASDQGEPVTDRAALQAKVVAVEERFAGREVPRPEHWGGYRVDPRRVELWQGRQARLHERVKYRRTETGWTRRLLQP